MAQQMQQVTQSRLEQPTVARNSSNNTMFDPMPRLKTSAAQIKRRSGFMKALVGSNHMVKCADGKLRQFQVLDIAAQKEAVPKAKAICLSCKKMWSTIDEMVEAHPTDQEMIDLEQPHVLAMWSEESTAPAGMKPDQGLVVGLMSNEYASQT